MADSTLPCSQERSEEDVFPLLALPVDVLVNIFSKLDAKSMAAAELVTGAFRARHPGSGIRLVEQAARDALERRYGPRQNYSWKYNHLRIFKHCFHTLCQGSFVEEDVVL